MAPLTTTGVTQPVLQLSAPFRHLSSSHHKGFSRSHSLSAGANPSHLSLLAAPRNRRSVLSTVKVRSQLNRPIISQDDHWGIWTALFAIASSGLWSEKTKIGSTVSAALVSTLVGLAASNLGIIPFEAPAYSVVLQFLLPLSVPLLLFRADLRRVLQDTGTLLLAFLLASGRQLCTFEPTIQHKTKGPWTSLHDQHYKSQKNSYDISPSTESHV